MGGFTGLPSKKNAASFEDNIDDIIDAG